MLTTETYEGAEGGMNAARAPHEIGDNQARTLVDYLVDQPGFVRSRGPLTQASATLMQGSRLTGLVQTLNPSSEHVVGYLADVGGVASVRYLVSPYSSVSGFSEISGSFENLSNNLRYIVDSKPALKGGSLIGTLSQYEAGSTQTLSLWRGGKHSLYQTGTVTVALGSTSVTGSGTSWLSNASPGMFLTDGTSWLGVVKTVNTDTSITLEEPSIGVITAGAYALSSIRNIVPRVAKGRITASTSSTDVDGFNTKFKDQGLGSGTWAIYRQRDKTYVGTVSSVTDNTNLTLTGNASIAMDDEQYVAIKQDLGTTLQVGVLNAMYAERQWYANLATSPQTSSYVWFSGLNDPEALDLTETDGDRIAIPSTGGVPTPIKALVPAFNSLLVLKENEAYGVFGQTSSTFEVRKVADDGVLCGMSAVQWGGGVIFAGRNGIYFYDGQEARNLTEQTLGDYYRSSVRTFNPRTHRMWGMLERDHYLCFIESVTPPTPITKGSTATTPSRLTIVIHLPTQAVSLFTNVNIRGALQLPASLGRSSWFAVNKSDTEGYVCDAAALFDNTGRDSFACEGDTAGPDPYIESKRYPMGDHMRKKLIKQLALTWLAAGADLALDTVVGLNDNGFTSASTFPVTVPTWSGLSQYPTWDELDNEYSTWDDTGSSIFLTKRIKFLKRATHFAFRLYGETNAVSAVKLGPWQIGFKPQRPGRI